MNKLLAILVLLFATTVQADSVYVGAWSSHWDYDSKEDKCKDKGCYYYPEDKLNHNNNLLAYEYKGFVVGHLTNSFNRSTWVAVYQFPVWTGTNFEVKQDFGLTHGYHSCSYTDEGEKGRTCLALAVEWSYVKYAVQPTLIFQPGTTALSFKYKF